MKKLIILFIALLTFSSGKSMNPGSILFQDPTRTPKNSNQVDPVRTVDGSTGKYKKDHKTSTGKDFATRKRHVKTAKPRKDNGKEKPADNSQGKEEKKG